MSRQTLYDSVRKIREIDRQPFNRILIAGYLNMDQMKAHQLEPEIYLRQIIERKEEAGASRQPNERNVTNQGRKEHSESESRREYTQSRERIAQNKNRRVYSEVSGYLYIKGNFYLHLLESHDVKFINKYLKQFMEDKMQLYKKLHNKITVVYQSYENTDQFFKNWDCDFVSAPNSVIVDTDKTEEQILDRSFEIYENLEDGAKKKRDNPAHKIANMFLLSSDDMSILICDQFMTLEEYANIYMKEQLHNKESQKNYPLPPSIFTIMDFLETDDYSSFKGK